MVITYQFLLVEEREKYLNNLMYIGKLKKKTTIHLNIFLIIF